MIEVIDSCNCLLLSYTYSAKKSVKTYIICNLLSKARVIFSHHFKQSNIVCYALLYIVYFSWGMGVWEKFDNRLTSGEAIKFFQGGANQNIKKIILELSKTQIIAQCIKLVFWTNSKGLRS